MSLTDDAQAVHDKRRRWEACKMAKELQAVFPTGEQMAEVVELLRADGIMIRAKWVVLNDHKVRISDSQFAVKMSDGCGCDWCGATWMAPVAE